MFIDAREADVHRKSGSASHNFVSARCAGLYDNCGSDRVAGGAHPGGCAPPGPQYSMSNALLSGKRCKSVVIHDEKRCPFHTRASAFCE
jgi:hypothetical protein